MLAGLPVGADRPDLPGGKPKGFARTNSASEAGGALGGAAPRLDQLCTRPSLSRQPPPYLLPVPNPRGVCALFRLQAVKCQQGLRYGRVQLLPPGKATCGGDCSRTAAQRSRFSFFCLKAVLSVR